MPGEHAAGRTDVGKLLFETARRIGRAGARVPAGAAVAGRHLSGGSGISGENQGNGLDFVLEPAVATAPAGGYGGAPISDLSYRNYDGPLHSRRARWWIVALNTLRLAKAKKGFWITSAISILPYLFIVLQLYLMSRAQTPQG